MLDAHPNPLRFLREILLCGVALGVFVQALPGQDALLIETGQVSVAGKSTPYRIRHLPVSSFPDLPAPIAAALTTRGCLIPQSYEAHRPENVIHGSFERAGSEDWAVLCSVRTTVSLLVFFSSAAGNPAVLVEAAETSRLDTHDASGELGFNWGLDRAAPGRIHDAQASMRHRPPVPDHDAIADSTLDGKTIYHLYQDDAWQKVMTE
jgi:hypothetical protein